MVHILLTSIHSSTLYQDLSKSAQLQREAKEVLQIAVDQAGTAIQTAVDQAGVAIQQAGSTIQSAVAEVISKELEGERRLAEIKFSIKELLATFDGLNGENITLRSTNAELLQQFEGLALEKTSLATERDNLTCQLTALTEDKTTLEQLIYSLTTDKASLDGQVSTLSADNVNLEQQVVALNSAKATLEEQGALLKEEKESLAGQASSLAADKTALTSQVSSLTSAKTNLEKQVADLTSQLSSGTSQTQYTALKESFLIYSALIAEILLNTKKHDEGIAPLKQYLMNTFTVQHNAAYFTDQSAFGAIMTGGGGTTLQVSLPGAKSSETGLGSYLAALNQKIQAIT